MTNHTATALITMTETAYMCHEQTEKWLYTTSVVVYLNSNRQLIASPPLGGRIVHYIPSVCPLPTVNSQIEPRYNVQTYRIATHIRSIKLAEQF